MTKVDRVYCPLVDEEIENIECIENSDVAAGMMKEETLPQKYKEKEKWREICKNCKYHNL